MKVVQKATGCATAHLAHPVRTSMYLRIYYNSSLEFIYLYNLLIVFNEIIFSINNHFIKINLQYIK